VETSYLDIDVYKFESPHKDESRAQSGDSSKAYCKPVELLMVNKAIVHLKQSM